MHLNQNHSTMTEEIIITQNVKNVSSPLNPSTQLPSISLLNQHIKTKCVCFYDT